MSTFDKFTTLKIQEFQAKPSSYRKNASLGTYPFTSRQPPIFHAYWDFLERNIPETSRGEILFEAIKAAFQEFIAKIPPDSLFDMDLNAYSIKSARTLDGELPPDGETGFYSSQSAKDKADEYLKARNHYSPSQLAEMFPFLVPENGDEEKAA